MNLNENEVDNKPRKSGRFWKIFGISLGVLVVLFIVFRLTGVLQWYSIASSGNAPTIQPGDYVFTTNLKSPQRFDFVTFEDEIQTRGEVWIKRLCAFEGETVEMRDGECYIDNQILDSHLDLSYSYQCATPTGEVVVKRLNLSPDQYYYNYPIADSMTLILTKEEASSRPLLTRYIKTAPDSTIQAFWNQPWNHSNFGPVVVPEGHYFLLGDSRDNSFDSRFMGCVREDKITGVAF